MFFKDISYFKENVSYKKKKNNGFFSFLEQSVKKTKIQFIVFQYYVITVR